MKRLKTRLKVTKEAQAPAVPLSSEAQAQAADPKLLRQAYLETKQPGYHRKQAQAVPSPAPQNERPDMEAPKFKDSKPGDPSDNRSLIAEDYSHEQLEGPAGEQLVQDLKEKIDGYMQSARPYQDTLRKLTGRDYPRH